MISTNSVNGTGGDGQVWSLGEIAESDIRLGGAVGRGKTNAANLAHSLMGGMTGFGKSGLGVRLIREVEARIAELEAAGAPYELVVGDPKDISPPPETD